MFFAQFRFARLGCFRRRSKDGGNREKLGKISHYFVIFRNRNGKKRREPLLGREAEVKCTKTGRLQSKYSARAA